MEILLSVSKCSDGKMEVIKEEVQCYKGIHFILIIIAFIVSIIQLILIICFIKQRMDSNCDNVIRKFLVI